MKKSTVQENSSLPYYLFVDDTLLVKVCKNVDETLPKEVDETPLLDTLMKKFKELSEENEDVKTMLGRDKRQPVREPPDIDFRRIAEGNMQVLIDFVQSNPLNIKTSGNGYSLFHFCVLGGWKKSFEFLQKIGLCECGPQFYIMLAAVGNRDNMCELAIAELNNQYKSDLISNALKIAHDLGHAKFLSSATRFYVDELRKQNNFMSRVIDYSSYNLKFFPNLEGPIPSLLKICTHVVAAETTNNPSNFAQQLASLPSTLSDLVFQRIAEDQAKGYVTLASLQRASPDLGKRIPTAAWVDSYQFLEQRVRSRHEKWLQYSPVNYELPLIDVFEEIDSFVQVPPDEFEASATTLCPQPREIGAPSIVGKSQFLQQFAEFTSGIFEGFDFSNVAVIGGSVIGSLLPIPTHLPERANDLGPFMVSETESNEAEADPPTKKAKIEQEEAKKGNFTPAEYYTSHSPFKSSDIDLCIYGLTRGGFKKKLRKIYFHLKKLVGEEKKVHIYKSASNVVLTAFFPFRHVQITLTSFSDLSHILSEVDIDCSAFAYDGKTLWASPRARLAVNRRWSLVNPELYEIRGCPVYELRLLKYANRGFSIVDRMLPMYQEPEEEPQIYDWQAYIPEVAEVQGAPYYSGAALLLGILKWPKVAQGMQKIGGGLPYGPTVGLEETKDYLDKLSESTDCGYGPADTCPVEIGVEELGVCDIDSHTPGFEVSPWYAELKKKEPKIENN